MFVAPRGALLAPDAREFSAPEPASQGAVRPPPTAGIIVIIRLAMIIMIIVIVIMMIIYHNTKNDTRNINIINDSISHIIIDNRERCPPPACYILQYGIVYYLLS